jgi:hypothetical protein
LSLGLGKSDLPGYKMHVPAPLLYRRAHAALSLPRPLSPASSPRRPPRLDPRLQVMRSLPHQQGHEGMFPVIVVELGSNIAPGRSTPTSKRFPLLLGRVPS